MESSVPVRWARSRKFSEQKHAVAISELALVSEVTLGRDWRLHSEPSMQEGLRERNETAVCPSGSLLFI